MASTFTLNTITAYIAYIQSPVSLESIDECFKILQGRGRINMPTLLEMGYRTHRVYDMVDDSLMVNE